MQAQQNFASARRAPAGGATDSTRAAVRGIFQTTSALLGDFQAALVANTRARRKEASRYTNNLQRSVQGMLAGMRQDREETAAATHEALGDYMAELHSNVAGAMRDAEEQLREISRRRRKEAHELAMIRAEEHEALCGSGRQHLERLARSRRKETHSLHNTLAGFAADLAGTVAQARKQFRQELGFDEPAPAKAKPQHTKASPSRTGKEEPRKTKSASSKTMARSSKQAAKASPAKRRAAPDLRSISPKGGNANKKSAKTGTSAQPQKKRRVH